MMILHHVDAVMHMCKSYAQTGSHDVICLYMHVTIINHWSWGVTIYIYILILCIHTTRQYLCTGILFSAVTPSRCFHMSLMGVRRLNVVCAWTWAFVLYNGWWNSGISGLIVASLFFGVETWVKTYQLAASNVHLDCEVLKGRYLEKNAQRLILEAEWPKKTCVPSRINDTLTPIACHVHATITGSQPFMPKIFKFFLRVTTSPQLAAQNNLLCHQAKDWKDMFATLPSIYSIFFAKTCHGISQLSRPGWFLRL